MNILDVLRKDTFFFLRDEPPDVKRYLPQYLNNEELFSNVQDALNIEHDNYRLKLVDVAKQFFVETATWGLDEWERFLKITPAAGASEDLRRAVIRVKRRGDTVMTVENTRRLLEDFAPRGSVEVRELGGNLLELVIHDGTFYWNEMMEALWEQLPAHLTFKFEINRNLPEPLHVGIINLQQGDVRYDRSYNKILKHPIKVVQRDITTGIQRFDIVPNKVVTRAKHAQRVGIAEFVSGTVRFGADIETPDEYTLEDFERYLRKRWAEFKQNPVVQHYNHNYHGDWDDGEIDDPDNPDEELFPPIDSEFLRLYWKFPYVTKKGENKIHLRYTTHYDPRDNITDGDIKAVGEIGAAGEIFIHSKKKIPTTGLFKAFWVKKTSQRII